MTNDEILQAAKEAGFSYVYALMWQEELERFAAIIEQRMIERCAVVCEQIDVESFGVLPIRVILISDHCAAAIRKLGEQ